MSNDNIVDLDADAVAVYPRCEHHDKYLERGGGEPTLTPDVDEVTGPFWWLDLSSFSCPGMAEEEANHYFQDHEYEVDPCPYEALEPDGPYEKCQNSWYTHLEVMLRSE